MRIRQNPEKGNVFHYLYKKNYEHIANQSVCVLSDQIEICIQTFILICMRTKWICLIVIFSSDLSNIEIERKKMEIETKTQTYRTCTIVASLSPWCSIIYGGGRIDTTTFDTIAWFNGCHSLFHCSKLIVIVHVMEFEEETQNMILISTQAIFREIRLWLNEWMK